MKTKLFFIILLAFSLPATAQAPVPLIAGHGTNTCLEYTQGRLFASQLETSYFDWAQGYMSATNTMLQTEKNPTRNLNATLYDDQKKYLRSYCAAHPSDPFQLAVVKLFFSFPATKAPAP